MYFVVDSNVVISALMKRGKVSEIFSLNSILDKFRFIAPNFLILEIGKHTERIMKKTQLHREMLEETLEFVMEQITFISEEEFKQETGEARRLLSEHEKDVPYLALALAFNCKIFSGDKVLKSIIQDRVESPTEVLGRINE